MLEMAPSTYYAQKARQADPTRLPPRRQRDAELSRQIERVCKDNFQVYGVRVIGRTKALFG